MATSINLGAIDRIPAGEGREFDLDGDLIVVFRSRAGTLYAVQATCPHRAGALADGMVGGDVVICPMHSFKFDLRTGTPIGNDCAALKTYAVSISPDAEIIVQYP